MFQPTTDPCTCQIDDPSIVSLFGFTILIALALLTISLFGPPFKAWLRGRRENRTERRRLALQQLIQRREAEAHQQANAKQHHPYHRGG